MSVLVLGIGNILLKDEGIGVHAIQEFEKRYQIPDDVTVVDGGTAGMELIQYIAGKDTLIIVDALKTGADVGTLIRLSGDEVPQFFRTKISPHQLGLSDMLAAMKLTDETPETVVLIGVIPKDLGTGLDLSDEIAGKIDPLVQMVVTELQGLGVELSPSETAGD